MDSKSTVVEPSNGIIGLHAASSLEVRVVVSPGQHDNNVVRSDLDFGLVSDEFSEESAWLGGFHAVFNAEDE